MNAAGITARYAYRPLATIASAVRTRIASYVETEHPLFLALDGLRVFAILCAPFCGPLLFRAMALSDVIAAPLHLQLFLAPALAEEAFVYQVVLGLALTLNAAWLTLSLRNFARITLSRVSPILAQKVTPENHGELPPWPWKRDSFTLVLAELQDRDGSVVPNERSPHRKPRWLTLPLKAQSTGVFITGSTGSGKTLLADRVLHQNIGFERIVEIQHADGHVSKERYVFSGLLTDEKGDFTAVAEAHCKEWGRESDFVRLSPGGPWLWNVIYNPNLPAWSVGYQTATMLKNLNKGNTGSDPFWEQKPKELLMQYLGLLHDAESYYTIVDYLDVLINVDRQDELQERALQRYADNPAKIFELQRRWRSIVHRRDNMTDGLKGSLQACAEAGLELFREEELRKTFCPTRDEYFFTDERGVQRPRPNVFVGFDQALDYGKIVGVAMSKNIYYHAAVVIQVALKSQWQDAILRRDVLGPDGQLLYPPRFGKGIGYAPSFLMADEAHKSVTPEDAEFKSLCRSKLGCVWELTQSHSSIRGAMGPSNSIKADEFFQNSNTHIYLRQSFDPPSLKFIQDECGKRLVPKTTVAVTEGGASSALSYAQGGIVHEGGMGFSSTKTTAIEEKPFAENEELMGLPNNVAIVVASNGQRSLPATIAFMRPRYIFDKYPHLRLETPWCKWPAQERGSYDLDSMPQTQNWEGWGHAAIQLAPVRSTDDNLGQFVQPKALAVAADAHGAEALEALAHLHVRMNQLPRAIEEFRRRIALGGEPAQLRQLRLELGLVCEKAGDIDAAIGTYNEIFETSPNDPVALQSLERLFEVGQRYEELEEILRKRALLTTGMERVALIRRRAKILAVQLDNDAAAEACLAEINTPSTPSSTSASQPPASPGDASALQEDDLGEDHAVEEHFEYDEV
jgi:hypothetical protein